MTTISQTDTKPPLLNRNEADVCFNFLGDEMAQDAHSSLSSSGPDDDDINYFGYDDDHEFETIFTTISQKQQPRDQNFKLTLKYLFKLLKFYKLEHYANELVDNGYFSPLSLTKLTNKEFDMFSVSPYDKKKFFKLQLFLKQVMSTIKMTCKKSSQVCLNADPNLDFKMFAISEWKHLANQSSTTSSSIVKQTSISNHQLKDNNQLNLDENKSSTTPIWTEISPKASPERLTQKEMKQMNKNTVAWTCPKPWVSRAKSIETNGTARKSANPVSPKSLVAVASDTNSVTHPAQHASSKSSSNFFGPKINSVGREFGNVELVNSKGYSYGVPQNLASKNKGFIRKTPAVSTRLGEVASAQTNSTLVTNEIFVFARKRPQLPSEAEYKDSVLVESGECAANICVDEVRQAVDGTPVLRKNEFNFDKTFDDQYSNEEIFKNSILPFINLPFKNRSDFNCICFGQTGSGKTHTLFGNKQQDGLCVLTAENLFNNNERLFCGFYEIYNGQLFDLINRNNKLVLREDASGQLNVVGLVEIEIKSIAQLRRTIEISQSNRHIGSTSFNKASSRSHAVIQFKVPNLPSSHSNSGHVIMKNINYSNVKSKVDSGLHSNNSNTGKPFRLLFIDLAGSERGIDAQNNIKDNRKEGAEINQSLLALKECIRCIDQYRAYAPFRQSKLTRVLRDCFVGTGNTILIATVSPTDDCVPCSLNTLQYANRVRQMALRNRKKQELVSKSTSTLCKNIRKNLEQHKQKVNSLPQKNEDLKKKIPEMSTNLMARIRSKSVACHNKKLAEPVSKAPRNSEKKPQNYLTNNAAKSPGVTTPAIQTPNNILRSKPLIKSCQSTGAKKSSLFHPSKINCSSTPIKSVIKNNSDYGPAEELLFVHDTPIKGHKLKHIPKSTSQMAELAERFFEKNNNQNKINYCSINSQNDYLNSRIYSNSGMAEKGNRAYDLPEECKNDDDESGVESDELNKSFESRKKMKNEQRIQDIYAVPPKPELNKAEITMNEERLNLLRKKQREMLEAKKYLASGDESFQNDSSDLNDNSAFSFKKYSETSEHLKNALDSQNQLRTYIQNLESKLTNLRNEIKDAGTENPEPVRKNSTDSTDSLKEEKISSFNKDVYSEFLQKRKHLEKQQENFGNFNFRRNFKFADAEDDLEKKFIESQADNFNGSLAEKDKQDDTLFSDNDAFEKSMYKGSSLFSKSFKSLETKFDSPIKKCEFSPIAQDKEKEPVITPRTQVLNPIPIRLSSSSSSFESSFSLRQALCKSESENLSPRLKTSSSKIWRVPSQESERCKNWSCVENQQVELGQNEKCENNEKPDKKQLIANHQNQLTDLSQACEREMNLIISLKDRKMDFKEYLNQMEEMLSKKVSSIRDLQNQITQLKVEID
ncbi:Kinesin KIF24 [Brachionus plicatilis]|uniref:Kinesin KIF24 n=1 Tax=Brachionus plicatilis TaxID=10195 RepID=A0A3M7QX43_BRAPC|nr:Kinesin KIF24 [Brachionus plicatilis]